MFEFSVARKYLIPRVRQLSVSCISLISIFVIALVVWLSIVFFSAQESIERKWTEKMVAITAPIRLIPTQKYYQSYYYQVDAYSQVSYFSHKTLREKLNTKWTDPHDPESDPSLPPNVTGPKNVDIVNETRRSVEQIPDFHISAFESIHGNVKVLLVRNQGAYEATISQSVLIVPFDRHNRYLDTSLIQDVSDGIVLPKSFKEAGARVGDSVVVSTVGFGAVSTKEIRQQAQVSGFYDPGIIPVGGKVILVTDSLFDTLAAQAISDSVLPSGLNVHNVSLKKVQDAKRQIQKALHQYGLASYWTVETYQEYPFTKDIFQQMQSDKNLFLLIACIIIVVASSNIVSMLIILVHDKRKEIAILQALGATKKSIALIFGFCGFCMGAIGSIMGSVFAVITLYNLDGLLAFFGKIQGFDVLNKSFYGDLVTAELSPFALFFVVLVCSLASVVSGVIASISACQTNTSEALKYE